MTIRHRNVDSNDQIYRFAPSLWPTKEDLSEVYSESTESVCRALVNGTLAPRPWYDIAGTWYSRVEGDNKGRYKADSTSHEKRVNRMRESVKRRVTSTRQIRLVEKAAAVLVANGMTPLDALLKAHTLLTKREEV